MSQRAPYPAWRRSLEELCGEIRTVQGWLDQLPNTLQPALESDLFAATKRVRDSLAVVKRLVLEGSVSSPG